MPWSRADKLFPVDILWACIFGDFIYPCSRRTVPVRCSFNQCNISQHSFLVCFPGFEVTLGLTILMAQLKNYPGFLDCIYYLIGFRNCPCHGFFTVNMFSSPGSFDGHGPMPVIGCCNDYSIDIISFYQFLIGIKSPGNIRHCTTGSFAVNIG